MSGELVAALAKAQAAFGPIPKNHTNPAYGSKYADLADVLNVVRPILNEAGFALVQPIEDGHLVTRLMLGGEVLESRVPLELGGKPQDLGSRLTYLRRYCLAALLGVASEDDDDGNAAQQAQPQTRRRRRNEPEEPKVSIAEVRAITEVFDAILDDDERKKRKREFVAEFGRPEDVLLSRVPEALAWLGVEPFELPTEEQKAAAAERPPRQKPFEGVDA